MTEQKYEIDFLPVGDGERSGDAIALRWEEAGRWKTMIVDGGNQDSGRALVEHFKDYYGTTRVDYVVNTHPDSDHASGLCVVLDEMEVGELWMHQPWDYSDDIYKKVHDGRATPDSVKSRIEAALRSAFKLHEAAEAKRIPIRAPFAGAQIGPFTVLGPDETWYRDVLLPDFRSTPAVKVEEAAAAALGVGVMDRARAAVTAVLSVFETLGLETLKEGGLTSAENNSSVILFGQLDSDGVLLTGDAGIEALIQAADLAERYGFDLPGLKMLQIPHHGSRNNVSPSILDRIVGPKLLHQDETKVAMVSASAKSKTHPRRVVTNAFIRRGCKVNVTRGQTWRYGNFSRPDWGPAPGEPFHSMVEE